MNNKKRNAFCSYCFVMTKRVILSLLLVLCLLATCPAQSVTLTISNPTSAQRSELVAIDAATLGIEVGKGVVVRDVSNIERPTQWTHDGKLLMEVHVRPHGKAVFTLQPGTPAAFLSWVDGRQYPERWDDIAFENDRIGFRLYGPALQKHGEKGYGYDLWVKRTTELVLGELYRNDPRLSFHLDYGKGVDCFAVGPTLGCGTPAMLQNGEIRFPWCYETYKILDKGPLRFTVQVDFPTTADGITEHRILSLDKGSNFVESTVWYEGLKRPTDVLAGFPVRSAGAKIIVHICGQMKAVYDKVAKINSDAFSFDAVVSLREAKHNLPGKAIMGNVSTFAIEMQDEKTVEKLTRACYMNGSDIISPACGLGMGSDLHNVQAVLRTVRTFTE